MSIAIFSAPAEMLVDSWFEYWISIKKKTVRYNTVRNYRERYKHNIQPVIGKMVFVGSEAFCIVS